eukprot:TRINITY_DN22203_c0_g1_i1.p1 TRINITY_DN22203_c0_g1~~TRINITY_DN22203_c0_g1_i1.p1  ORF type:complete len:319 (+),score=39.06 TRINITY_DN22203_c0_g1_i1:78-959(+)
MVRAVLALDCGSGGTRVWKGDERLPWPSGGKAPVMSEVLRSKERVSELIPHLRALVTTHGPCFIGATAGVRYSLENGIISDSDVQTLRSSLPDQCVFSVLSPIQEARLELRCMLHHLGEPAVMLSMGGKSMQLGTEGALYSLPFAMHLGYDALQSASLCWPDRIAALGMEYRRRVEEEQKVQQISTLEGNICGITDTVDAARQLGLVNRPLTVQDFLAVVSAKVASFMSREQGDAGLSRGDYVLIARLMLLDAVLSILVSPASTLAFRDDFVASWTAGFFHEGADMNAAEFSP